MKKNQIKLVIIAMAMMITMAFSASVQADYQIGILAKRGAQKTYEKWNSTAEYLTRRVGERFTVVPLKFVEIDQAVKTGRIDFLLANSAFYVVMREKYGVKAIATLMNAKKGLATYEFGGVIFARRNSSIKKLSDIKGKKFMCVKYSSFGGAHMAWRLLMENGIDPRKDCKAFLEGGTHDKVVMAVKSGAVDVGTVRSDTLERMEEEGLISMSQFYVINQIRDSFPFAHSTRLYPVWPMAKTVKTDTIIARKVSKALMLIEADSKVSRDSKVTGWTYPADYEPVRDCLVDIKYGIFANM
ncbi:MAG: phosphate/phosphite/phosphonate ABC transporter substrate-binding protein [Thermodesulfobacteriota bacterium]|nr:phosphate/phosphite/phosphonate ABC transporter substrate-binding protein [Thermodesulfobacteriota bacterium]